MAGNDSQRDNNFVTSLLAVSSADFKTLVTVAANPITHALLADLSGGFFSSSLALEIPTGTVNSVNTVFTVQNSPLFFEVSGQVMVSQAQDATNYGYVLTGTGPYTTTFVNPPTQKPHSFYTASSSGTTLSAFFQTDYFTSTAGQTLFTTSLTPVFVFSFIVNDQPQTIGANYDYTQSGSAFTLNNGIPANLRCSISYLHN